MNEGYYADISAWLEFDSAKSASEKLFIGHSFPIPVDANAAIKRINSCGKNELLLIITCMRELWASNEASVSACVDLSKHPDSVVRGAALFTLQKIAPTTQIQNRELKPVLENILAKLTKVWNFISDTTGTDELLGE